MALLNGRYLFVDDEKVKHNITTCSHPVEEGIDLSDHVIKEAQEISISGKIVGIEASSVIAELVQWQATGTLVSYVGRNYASNYQIVAFNTSHPNTVHGGCDFDMTLREIRVAQSPYIIDKNTAGAFKTPTKSCTKTGMQQVQKNATGGLAHIVKRGETLYSIAKSYSSKGATVASVLESLGNHGKVKISERVYIGER